MIALGARGHSELLPSDGVARASRGHLVRSHVIGRFFHTSNKLLLAPRKDPNCPQVLLGVSSWSKGLNTWVDTQPQLQRDLVPV